MRIEVDESAQCNVDIARRDAERAQHSGNDAGCGLAEGEQVMAVVDALVAAVESDLQGAFRGQLRGLPPLRGRPTGLRRPSRWGSS